MLSISAISKAEKNKLNTGSAFLILLDIRLTGGKETIRICYNNEDIEYKGELYQAFPFKISEAREETDGSDPSIKLQIDNTARTLQWHIEKANGAMGTEVVLSVVNSENLEGEADLKEYYRVLSCDVSEHWITFTLGNEYSARSRRPLNRYMKDSCPFKYKGLCCKYKGSLDSCTHTLQDCRKHGNSENFGGFPGVDQGGVYAKH